VDDRELTATWAKMQTSDHFYWMATKGGTDGSVHSYFTPYPSPYDAYIYYMNVLADLQIRLQRAQGE
jgi:alpha-amylase